MTITAVTTCMGRRYHLETTLPFMLQTFDKVVMVDWSCPEKSGEYAQQEGAQVFYQHGESYYSGSRAKNAGAKLVTSDYIAFVDADTICMPTLRTEIQGAYLTDRMLLSARNVDGTDVNDTTGFLLCATEKFWSVGGFDESYIGWGSEDLQLRGKLFLDAKLEVHRLSHMALGALAHGNDSREAHREIGLSKSAVANFEKLKGWFAEKGIPDYPHSPALKDIVFNGPRDTY